MHSKRLADKRTFWKGKRHSWELQRPPIRPSGEEVMLYHDLIKKSAQTKLSKDTSVLILGATPELRDLCAQMNLRCHLYDQSVDMLQDMSELLAHADTARETHVVADWLDEAVVLPKFDIILGDLVLQQMAPDDEHRLLARVRNLLAPAGSFIARVHFVDYDAQHIQEQDIAAVWEAYATGAPAQRIECINHVKLIVSWMFVDPKRRSYDRRAAREAFERFMEQCPKSDQAVLRDVHRSLQQLEYSYKRWCPPTWQELEAMLHTYFKPVSIQRASDYPLSHFYPTVVLK